jgi:hypothetical protein
MTHNKIVQTGTGRYHEERKKLAKNQREKIVGRKKRLEPSPPRTHIKQKQCYKKIIYLMHTHPPYILS